MSDGPAARRPVVGTHQRFCDALVSLGGPQIFLQRPVDQRARRQVERSPPRTDARRHSFVPRRASAAPREPTAAAELAETSHRPSEAQHRAPARLARPPRQAATSAAHPALLDLPSGPLPGQDADARAHHLRFFFPADGAARRTPHPNTQADCIALQASYFQVVKESVVAFHGCRLYAQLLQRHEPAGELDAHAIAATTPTAVLPRPPLPGSSAASTTSRQAALRSGIEAYLRAVAQQEATLWKARAACRAHIERLGKGGEDGSVSAGVASSLPSPRHLLFAQLPSIPLQRWAGASWYNGWHVRCSSCCPATRPATSATKRKGTAAATPPTALSGSLLPPPKPLVLPTDLEQELRRYWKLHDEADARARLDALRCGDAEAFAQHVSLLKVSALLDIMEKTEAFMRRIGLRLQAQAGLSQRDPTSTTAVPATCATPGHASEYERFRAYVASTKNEFKLMHRVEAFVAAQPAGLEATLLPHQMDGLRFLASLDANQINGILADEMGVGKTIQTLAFLLHLKHPRASVCARDDVKGGAAAGALAARPHLVLAPLSVIREWREACEQFVPLALRVALFQELADPVRDAAQYDLVLLPVHAVRHVAAEAARVPWHYIVVDEAHKAVANLNTITAQCILALPCRRRLVLTGTPLSSDLQELWSLLHFLNPHVFTDNDAFDEVFRRPFRVYGAQEMELTAEERGLLILRLHQVLRPFLLRRTKADIDASLRMTFHHVWCPMTAVQRRLLCMLREERRTPTMLTAAASSTSSDSEESAEAAAAPAVADESADNFPCASEKGALQADTQAALPFPASDAPSACRRGEPGADADALTALVRQHLPGLAELECDDDLCSAVQANKALGLRNAGTGESAAQLVCNHAFLHPFFSQVLHRHGLDELTHELDAEAGRADPAGGVHVRDGATRSAPTRPRGAADTTLACSGKFLVLHLLLARLSVAGRKAVLFTHWLDCVDLLAEYLQSRGWGPHTEVLTGASSEAERRASVRRFREDPSCLFFLLSIKAGGCGINLQAAHMVVLLDRDYTATNEDQALARVYRIGQRHTVRAVYLSTDDASEQRVAQRAAEKNRPREAIIDAGVYQVSASAAAAAAAEAEPCGAQHVRSDALWQLLPSCTLLARAGGGAGGSSMAAEPFWAALAHLVEQLDDLVLTAEDRSELASTSTNANACDAVPGAAARLRATRPPSSTEELRRWLAHSNCADAVAASTALRGPSAEAHVCGADGTLDESAGDVALHEERGQDEPEGPAADGSARKARAISSCDTTAASAPSTCAPPAPVAALPHPWHRRAHFWLEYVHLLRTAQRGPRVLVGAVDAAVRHDAAREDPAAHARRRQRRARRAAKRLRLASLEVPDAFREVCWAEHGIDDDAEVAARYMRHVDAQARRGPLKRRRQCTSATSPPAAASGEDGT